MNKYYIQDIRLSQISIQKSSEGPNLLRFSNREVLKCKIESYLIILHLSTLSCHKQPEPRMHNGLFLDQYFDDSKYQIIFVFKTNSILVLNIIKSLQHLMTELVCKVTTKLIAACGFYDILFHCAKNYYHKMEMEFFHFSHHGKLGLKGYVIVKMWRRLRYIREYSVTSRNINIRIVFYTHDVGISRRVVMDCAFD